MIIYGISLLTGFESVFDWQVQSHQSHIRGAHWEHPGEQLGILQKSRRAKGEPRNQGKVIEFVYSWWYSIEKWWSGEPIVNIDIICSSTESYSSCVFVWDFKSRHLEVPQIQSRFGQMCRLLGRAVQHMVLRCAQDSIWIDNFDICLIVR